MHGAEQYGGMQSSLQVQEAVEIHLSKPLAMVRRPGRRVMPNLGLNKYGCHSPVNGGRQPH